ncbi:four helix bundle protein [Methylobacterium sp. JK268]
MESERPITSYRDLDVWQGAMTLAEECYRVTAAFPREELFGMTSQIRRASASIAANIAEGHGRESTPSFVNALRIAQGSLKELETHVLLSQRVGLMAGAPAGSLMAKCDGLGRQLRSLIRSLQRRASAEKGNV